MGRRSSAIQKLDPFEMKVDTTIAGDSGVGGFSIKTGAYATGTNKFKVDWGDGIVSAVTSSTEYDTITHTYSVADTYWIKIYGRLDSLYYQMGSESDKIIEVSSWGNIKWKDFSNILEGSANLTGITTTTPPILEMFDNHNNSLFPVAGTLFYAFRDTPNLNNAVGVGNWNSWDVSQVANMQDMFYNSGFNQPIGDWDVSNVTRMSNMFNLSNFDQDIGSWDVSSCTNFESMFDGMNFNNSGSTSISGWTFGPNLQSSAFRRMFRDNPSFNQPIGNWNIKPGELLSTFQNASSFDQDIGSWDVRDVTSMTFLFRNSAFNNGGNPSISGWTTSAVTQMWATFYDNTSFNQPIGNWDTSNVGIFYQCFRNADSFNQDIGSWDVSSCTDMREMFYLNNGFNNSGSTSINNWDTSNVTTMSSMFRGSPFNQPIGDWDVSNCTNFSQMFESASQFNQPLSGWVMTAATTFYNMFRNADSFDQDLSNWEFPNVGVGQGNPMTAMFQSNDGFNNGGVPLTWTVPPAVTYLGSTFSDGNNFNVDVSTFLSVPNNVTSMAFMFHQADNFNNGGSPSISGWTTSGVTDMTNTFYRTSFNQPIGSWDVSNVTTMYRMLKLSDFDQDISNWDVSKVTNFYEFMYAADGVGGASLSNWDVSNVTTMYRMFYACSPSFNGDGIDNWVVTACTNMTEMFGTSGVINSSSLTNNNYNRILTGWTGWDGVTATTQLKSNISINFGDAQYYTGTTSEDARNYLENTLAWTITDAGGISPP